MPRNPLRQGQGICQRGSGHSPSLGLQSGILTFRRHAFRDGLRLHQDASDPGSGIQRLHPQLRLRDGRGRGSRLCDRRQTRQPYRHETSPVPSLHPVLPPDPVHRQGSPPRHSYLLIAGSSATFTDNDGGIIMV